MSSSCSHSRKVRKQDANQRDISVVSSKVARTERSRTEELKLKIRNVVGGGIHGTASWFTGNKLNNKQDEAMK